MRMRAKAAAVGLGLTVALGAPAGAAPCVSKDEQSAILVRLLSNEMMVGYLTCRGYGYNELYSAFVQKHSKQLVADTQVMRRYYRRLYGDSGTHYFDKYVSAIANEASLRSMNLPDYCTAVGDVFKTALRTEHRDLPAYAAGQYFGTTAPQSCAPANKPRTAESTKPVQAAAASGNGKKK